MTRYITRAGLWRAPIDEEWPRSYVSEPERPAAGPPTAYEPEGGPRNTGLLDAHGNAIYADDEKRVGFLP